jgi:PAS domain S-box-containing protein
VVNEPYFIFYQSAMILSLIASVFVMVLAWRYRKAPGALAMLALAAATFIWTLGFFLEAHSDTLERQLLFTNVGYIGSMSVPVAWFIFALHYTRGTRVITGWKILPFCIIPVATMVLVWTNPWHRLMWSNEHLITFGLFTVTAKTYGPFFWIALAHNYLFIIVGVIILIRRLFVGTPLYVGQAFSLLVAVSLPLIWNFIYVFDLFSLPRKDLTPVMFAVSGIAIILGLIRFQLFAAVPFAHQFLIHQMRDGIFVFDEQKRLLEVNPSALKILDADKTIIGKRLEYLAHDFPLLKRLSNARSGFELPLTVSGEERFYVLETVAMHDNEYKQIGQLTILHDITERKEAEEEMKLLEEKAQIASRLSAVGELASGVAHEINNPLTSVIGYAELLVERDDVPKDVRSDLAAIIEGGRRVADIVQRLLTFGRESRVERTNVNINEIIDAVLKLRAYTLITSNIKVTTQLATDLPVTVADTGQLQQVFLNLIINAENEMKLTQGEGMLLIKTEAIGDSIRISFQDNGPGIARENLTRIFDPFFTTRSVGQGTGLGLSICHGIVTEHKGAIWVESEPGKGATFIVELPVVTGIVPEQLIEPEVEEPRKTTGAKILVVDDEPEILKFLSRILKGEGHEVDAVDNARDALEKLGNKRYRLILVDIKMSGMSGIEFYKQAQKIALSLSRRIIFMSGDVIGKDTEAFLSRTRAPHLTKPFDVKQLKEEIRRALGEDR